MSPFLKGQIHTLYKTEYIYIILLSMWVKYELIWTHFTAQNWFCLVFIVFPIFRINRYSSPKQNWEGLVSKLELLLEDKHTRLQQKWLLYLIDIKNQLLTWLQINFVLIFFILNFKWFFVASNGTFLLTQSVHDNLKHQTFLGILKYNLIQID